MFGVLPVEKEHCVAAPYIEPIADIAKVANGPVEGDFALIKIDY